LNPFKHFVIAWQFLTIIPVAKHAETAPTDLARSMAFYPVVGLLLGGILWVFWKGLSGLLPSSVSDWLLIALLVILTGGLHLDGLADTADGLWGGRDREQALKIMRDEQIGSFGVIALILVLVAKYLALTQVPFIMKGQVLLGLPVMGRWSMVLVSYFSEYAREGPGLARPFIEHLSRRELAVSTLTVLLILVGLFKIQGLIYFAVIILISFLCGWYFRRKLGGVTGDCLGTVGELVEVSFLLSVIGVQRVIQ
jgi:adenosylcobinamide-GDP ribazoletransferase